MLKNTLSGERAEDRAIEADTGRTGSRWARRPVQGNINALPAVAPAGRR